MTGVDPFFLGIAASLLTAILFTSIKSIRNLRSGDLHADRVARHTVDDALDQVRRDTSFENLLNYNRSAIEHYHSQTRTRARWALAASLVALLIGLILLGIGVYFAIYASDPAAKILVSALASVGGILSSYIAKTFSQTYRQVEWRLQSSFHESVALGQLLAAERLAQELDDKDRQATTYDRIIGQLLVEPGNLEQIPVRGRPRFGPSSGEELSNRRMEPSLKGPVYESSTDLAQLHKPGGEAETTVDDFLRALREPISNEEAEQRTRRLQRELEELERVAQTGMRSRDQQAGAEQGS